MIPLRASLLVFVVMMIFPSLVRGAEFVVPTEEVRAKALGDVSDESEVMKKLLAADADFPVIAQPNMGDWLASHREYGQSFASFLKSKANKPDGDRRVIYFFPIGKFPEIGSPSLEALREYAAAFFQMEVRVLPGYEPGTTEFSPRVNQYTNYPQILTGPVMAYLRARLPEDAYCLIGVTMTDLYPDKSWNYVFGQASLRERVGIFSFARYDAVFFGKERPEDLAEFRRQMLWRSCHTLAHEIAHMFGLWHCVYYQCVVNGSNSLEEADRQPQHACVVCLRKLHESIGFDPVKRYRDLEAFYRKHGMRDEAEWVARQLGKVKEKA